MRPTVLKPQASDSQASIHEPKSHTPVHLGILSEQSLDLPSLVPSEAVSTHLIYTVMTLALRMKHFGSPSAVIPSSSTYLSEEIPFTSFKIVPET
jgi:hypothetical protein